MPTRISRCTGWPIRRKNSRTSWVFPSPTTTRHQELTSLGVVRTSCTSLGTTLFPSITVPFFSLATSFSSGRPFTFTRYSRRMP